MSKKVLIVSATQVEMPSAEAETLISGIGMVATTFTLTQKLSKTPFDLVINIGIAGSFNPNFKIGSTVQVISERICELGVEDNGAFIPADEMNLCTKKDVFFETSIRAQSISEAQGITVNRVHGTTETIDSIRKQFNPDVETMEGAAVAYVCEQFGIPWVQIRTISNMVEPRNRDAWDVPLAIKNLHFEVLKYLDSVTK